MLHVPVLEDAVHSAHVNTATKAQGQTTKSVR